MSGSGFAALDPSVQYHVVNTLGWRSLRPLQEQAIEPILAGRNALLGAPTAGGKTEAALFPLLSRMVDERWAAPSVLYVCPLRALINNLEPRVVRYCELLGRRAAMWHGDVGQGDRKRILNDPPDVLLTTPESLEAMFMSTRVDARQLFGSLRAVVVDEIHAFAGDDRGWHLLSVLARLEELPGHPLQRIGLTATVGNPEWLLDWLTTGAGGQVVVPADEAPSAEFQIDYVGDLTNAAHVMAALHPGEKRLAFADSRARVEELATGLRGQEITTFVSHSSLSRDERHQAEKAFAEARDCVIAATSTLELGIDVGDLDRVIQIDAPNKVSSVLQRIGRTGRRPGTSRNCLFLALEPQKLLQATAIVKLIRDGWVEELEAPALPVHLVAQQLLARVLSDSRLGRSEWPGSFASVARQAGVSAQVGRIADEMVQVDVLAEHDGVLSIGQAGERLYGRRHFMEVMSMFLTEPLFVARHGQRDIGYVDPSSLSNPDGTFRTILLSGRAWDVVEIDWQRRVGWMQPSKDPGKIRWGGSGQPLSRTLCSTMRSVLVDSSPVLDVLSKRARSQLEALRDEFSWLDYGRTVFQRDPDRDQATWWTFAGGRANAQLAAGLSDANIDVSAVDDLFIKVRDVPSFESFREALAAHCTPPAEPRVPDPQVEELKFVDCLPRELAVSMLSARQRDDQTVLDVLNEPIVLVD